RAIQGGTRQDRVFFEEEDVVFEQGAEQILQQRIEARDQGAAAFLQGTQGGRVVAQFAIRRPVVRVILDPAGVLRDRLRRGENKLRLFLCRQASRHKI